MFSTSSLPELIISVPTETVQNLILFHTNHVDDDDIVFSHLVCCVLFTDTLYSQNVGGC